MTYHALGIGDDHGFDKMVDAAYELPLRLDDGDLGLGQSFLALIQAPAQLPVAAPQQTFLAPALELQAVSQKSEQNHAGCRQWYLGSTEADHGASHGQGGCAQGRRQPDRASQRSRVLPGQAFQDSGGAAAGPSSGHR